MGEALRGRWIDEVARPDPLQIWKQTEVAILAHVSLGAVAGVAASQDPVR